MAQNPLNNNIAAPSASLGTQIALWALTACELIFFAMWPVVWWLRLLGILLISSPMLILWLCSALARRKSKDQVLPIKSGICNGQSAILTFIGLSIFLQLPFAYAGLLLAPWYFLLGFALIACSCFLLFFGFGQDKPKFLSLILSIGILILGFAALGVAVLHLFVRPAQIGMADFEAAGGRLLLPVPSAVFGTGRSHVVMAVDPDSPKIVASLDYAQDKSLDRVHGKSLYDSNQTVIVQPSDPPEITPIRDAKRSACLTVDRTSHTILAYEPGARSVVRYDLANLEQVDKIELRNIAQDVSMIARHASSGGIVLLDAESRRLTIPGLQGPAAVAKGLGWGIPIMATTPMLDMVYVCNPVFGLVREFSLPDLASRRKIRLLGTQYLTIDPQGRRFFAVQPMMARITVVDIWSFGVSHYLPAPFLCGPLVSVLEGKALVVSDRIHGQLIALDVLSGAVIGKIAVGPVLSILYYQPYTDQLYFDTPSGIARMPLSALIR